MNTRIRSTNRGDLSVADWRCEDGRISGRLVMDRRTLRRFCVALRENGRFSVSVGSSGHSANFDLSNPRGRRSR